MEVNQENIEFIKRKLKDYKYYTDAINECDIKLIDLRESIKECYKASGVSYDSVLSNGDPNYSRVVELINKEYSVVLHKEGLEKKRDALGLNDLLPMLSDEQRELIELHYFKGYSQNFIAVNKQYNYIEVIKRKLKKAIIFLVKRY